MIISLYFEKEMTKNGKIVHVNFLLLINLIEAKREIKFYLLKGI